MKIILASLLSLFLVGCQTTETINNPFEVKVPIFTKPTIERISRPELRSENLDTTDIPTIIRAVKIDLESLKTYSIQLENQLDSVVIYED